MGKNKLSKFAENATWSHLLQPDYDELIQQGFPYKGKWSAFFKNQHPLTLELACGKGEYSIGLGQLYPERNFVGMDVKGARLWRGAKTVAENDLQNIAFLRQRIALIPMFFAPEDKVEAIWIIFPDPQPRKSKASKRLTSPEYLSRYRNFMDPNGIIHLKTDAESLYDFTLETIQEQGLEIITSSRDVYQDFPGHPELSIRTFYESIWLDMGKKIHYLAFRIGHEPA
jgi:tRNA (guanine-N7-)-methyltransferase